MLKVISDVEASALLKSAAATSPSEYAASAIDLATAASKDERVRTLAEVRVRLEAGEHLDDVLAE